MYQAAGRTLTLTSPDSHDFVNGSQVFYNPTSGSGGGFTVAASTSDPDTPVSVQFPNIFTTNDGGAAQTATPFSKTYSWLFGASASGPFTVTATSGGGSSSTSFTVTPDIAAPITAITCNSATCA